MNLNLPKKAPSGASVRAPSRPKLVRQVYGSFSVADTQKLSWQIPLRDLLNREDTPVAPSGAAPAVEPSRRAKERQYKKSQESSRDREDRIVNDLYGKFTVCLKWAAHAIMRFPGRSGYLGSYKSMWVAPDAWQMRQRGCGFRFGLGPSIRSHDTNLSIIARRTSFVLYRVRSRR